LKGKNTITPVQGTAPISPIEIDNYFDLGYYGVEKDFPELKVKIPHKNQKERNSAEHRKNIKKLRSKRVVSEHAVGKMKK